MASSSSVEVQAPVSEVFAVLADISSYPDWFSTIKKAEIGESDSEGRPTTVTLTIDAGMMKDKPTLTYDWSKAPQEISFTLDDANLLTQMDGTYVLTSLDSDTTKVEYRLTTAVSMPIPQMMLTKAEEGTISTALKELAAKFE
jgi:ribosome-associated toxin RatA of RatAB toxin-antitoxin module